MIEQQKVKVVLHCANHPVQEGEIVRQVWSKKERMLRASKFAGLLFIIALVALPIPALHFLVTPLCLLASPVVGIFLFLKKSQLAPSNVRCPACAVESMTLAAAERWPLWHICGGCREHVRIEKAG